jgi:xanthine dehydrogenase accessory factor
MHRMAIAGILLAAGSAARMGRNKLLLELDFEPLVRRAARRALEAGLDPLLVVVGHEADGVRAALSGLDCRLVDNPEWLRGQSSSLSVGAAAVPPDAEAAVVLLADMPFVEAATIRAVLARWRETGAPIVSSRYGEVPAPPTLYARSLLTELQGGEGEGRGREVVRRHRERVAWVELAAAALADVDFPEDLERARAAPGPEARATTDDAVVLDRAAAWIDAGVALATVTSTWGSALRPTGSQLAVNDRGDFAGSVSGGCIETAVVQEALEVIRDGKARRLAYGVTNEQAWELGMACGGQIEVYAERVASRMSRDVLHHLRGDLQARRQAVLCTWLAKGEARLLHPMDPGDDSDLALLEQARDAALLHRSRAVDTAEGPVFLRVYDPPVRLVLVGAVHIAQALAPMARLAGLDVIVVDPRRAFATAGRFPGAKLEGDWPAPALARIGLDRRTAVVTLSHDPKIDDPALVAALRSEAFHVGALGSKKTQAARRERMRGEGFSEADVARIRGPVGLDIGAVSPGEIAVSILAEVVARMRGPGLSGPA